MKLIRQKSRISDTVTILLFALLVFSLNGCSGNSLKVLEISGGNTLRLDADDVVEIMFMTGFSEEEIIQHGEDVYNGIALLGGVQITKNGNVIATFNANGEELYIYTLNGGFSIYNVNSKRWLVNQTR